MWKHNKKQSSENKFQILNARGERENIIRLFDLNANKFVVTKYLVHVLFGQRQKENLTRIQE